MRSAEPSGDSGYGAGFRHSRALRLASLHSLAHFTGPRNTMYIGSGAQYGSERSKSLVHPLSYYGRITVRNTRSALRCARE